MLQRTLLRTCGETPDVERTADGHYLVLFRGKRYHVKEEQLEDFLARLGMQMVLRALQAAQEDNEQEVSRKAYLYHNGDEAGESWVRREN